MSPSATARSASGTKHQRCWVHKIANVLNKVALSVQVNMKDDLREIYGAPTRAAAEVTSLRVNSGDNVDFSRCFPHSIFSPDRLYQAAPAAAQC
jgi:transposase-like protein